MLRIIEDIANSTSVMDKTDSNECGKNINGFYVLAIDNASMCSEGAGGLAAPSERQVLVFGSTVEIEARMNASSKLLPHATPGNSGTS